MLPQYPVFTNIDTAVVNWSKISTQKGVYSKDSFFYEVNPFTIKSLDVLVTDSLRFAGTLTSAGILPQITEPLKVRPDYSLGLEKTISASVGLPVYGEKGTLTGRIDLSDRGYLNSTTWSKDFIFLPDSMKTLAKNFTMAEVNDTIGFPAVHGDSVKEFWLPYKDSLLIASTSREMAMYHDQSALPAD